MLFWVPAHTLDMKNHELKNCEIKNRWAKNLFQNFQIVST